MIQIIDTSTIDISIHAPREGCDRCAPWCGWPSLAFQSTHPVRGATPPPRRAQRPNEISIHAPREGCDLGSRVNVLVCSYFNPRTP